MMRLAQLADVPRLVEMGQRFRAETSYSRHLTENPEQMGTMAAFLIERNGVVVSERAGQVVGMLGYLLYPHFLSGEMVAGEVFWWVEPEHRGEGVKLLRDAERRAKLAGAVRMQMIAPTDKAAALYRRFGYEFVEAAYQRTL
jgi:GNAT superfamily N-acetyltransferase